MTDFAQTNIQLYSQMAGSGYSSTEISRVAASYGLAVEVCGSLMRGSGKTLLSHLVGTASILVWLGRPADSVIAGLLHAAYEDGDFGRRSQRKELTAVAGEDVEALVTAYQELRWNYTREQVLTLSQRVEQMSETEREAVLIRIVNELEDNLDLAPLYHGAPSDGPEVKKSADWRVAYAEAIQAPLAGLAVAMGEQELAAEIEARFDEVIGGEVPPGLRTGHRNIWLAAPRSGRLLRRVHRTQVLARKVRQLGWSESFKRFRRLVLARRPGSKA